MVRLTYYAVERDLNKSVLSQRVAPPLRERRSIPAAVGEHVLITQRSQT